MQRDVAPDVLRGFALLGILLVNLPFFALASESGIRGEWLAGSANTGAAFLLVTLFQGKFYLLFSFLFGYSSSYIVRGERRHRRRWVKRAIVLMLFGALHFTLLWHGDILFAYGFFALILTAFLFRSDRTVRIWLRTIFAFFAVILSLVAALTYVAERVAAEDFLVEYLKLDEVMLGGSYIESIGPRIELWALGFFGSGLILQGGLAFAAMLTGVLAARNQFLGGAISPARSARMARYGLALGLPIQLFAGYIYVQNENSANTTESLFVTAIVISFLGAPLLTMGYIGLILKALELRPKFVVWMRPAGQLSLTVYLSQSLILSLIYGPWGLGLFQKVDIWLALLIGILIWVVQLNLARLWVDRLGSGPAERVLTRLSRTKPNDRFLTLAEIKPRWNEVLDRLERDNRTAWLAFFDARLASFDGTVLRLSFVDAEKLGGAHDFKAVRKKHLRKALAAVASEVYGVKIKIVCD